MNTSTSILPPLESGLIQNFRDIVDVESQTPLTSCPPVVLRSAPPPSGVGHMRDSFQCRTDKKLSSQKQSCILLDLLSGPESSVIYCTAAVLKRLLLDVQGQVRLRKERERGRV